MNSVRSKISINKPLTDDVPAATDDGHCHTGVHGHDKRDSGDPVMILLYAFPLALFAGCCNFLLASKCKIIRAIRCVFLFARWGIIQTSSVVGFLTTSLVQGTIQFWNAYGRSFFFVVELCSAATLGFFAMPSDFHWSVRIVPVFNAVFGYLRVKMWWMVPGSANELPRVRYYGTMYVKFCQTGILNLDAVAKKVVTAAAVVFFTAFIGGAAWIHIHNTHEQNMAVWKNGLFEAFVMIFGSVALVAVLAAGLVTIALLVWYYNGGMANVKSKVSMYWALLDGSYLDNVDDDDKKEV